MQKGFRLKFHTRPPLRKSPPAHLDPSISASIHLEEVIPALLQQNTIREVQAPFPKMFYSRIFFCPKKDGSVRPIIDLSDLNKLLVIPKFKMEHVRTIKRGLCTPLWGCTADIEKAFHNVPIWYKHQKYLAFSIGKYNKRRVFVWQFLPFGLSLAPWAFHRIVKPIKVHLRDLMFQVVSYLDDFAFFATSKAELYEASQEFKQILKRLNLSINWEKSDFTPRRSLIYLGVKFALKPFSLAPGGEDSFGSVSMRQVNRSPDMLQKKFRIPSRASKFRSNLCPFRTSPSSASDKVVESPHFSSPEGSPHSFRQCGEILNSGLDVQVLPVDARSHAPSTPNRGTHDGCVQGGVVWGSPTSEGTKAMAGLSLFNPYQLVGAKGSPFVTSALPTYAPRPDGLSVDRQYHSPILSPKPRFQDHSSHALDRGHLRTMRFPKHQISAAPSPGCPQRPGGCRLQVSSNLHGVDARQIHLQTDCSSSSHFSPSGPLRHSGQPPAGELCVSLPRPKRGGLRCTPLELEQVAIHLPVSSPSSSPGMLLHTRRVRRRRSARDRCTSLCGRSLGTQTEMQVQHSPHSSSSQPSHGQRRNVRFPPQFSASRLDTVNKVFKDQGFAANTLRIFDQRHAPSTSKSYQFVWGLLYKYLEERGINAENFQKKYVWHFLTYHHEVLLKKYRTLAKYRAALVEPLKFAVGYDLNTCGFSPGYMRGLFRIRPPVVSAPMPTWTLISSALTSNLPYLSL